MITLYSSLFVKSHRLLDALEPTMLDAYNNKSIIKAVDESTDEILGYEMKLL